MPRQSARMRAINGSSNVTPLHDPETAAYLAQLQQMDREDEENEEIEDFENDPEDQDDYYEQAGGISVKITTALVMIASFFSYCVGVTQGLHGGHFHGS